MPSVWDMILQWGSAIKVSIELPVANRHRRAMTEKLMKATLNPNTHTHTSATKRARQFWGWELGRSVSQISILFTSFLSALFLMRRHHFAHLSMAFSWDTLCCSSIIGFCDKPRLLPINRDYYMVTFTSSPMSSRGKRYQPKASLHNACCRRVMSGCHPWKRYVFYWNDFMQPLRR